MGRGGVLPSAGGWGAGSLSGAESLEGSVGSDPVGSSGFLPGAPQSLELCAPHPPSFRFCETGRDSVSARGPQALDSLLPSSVSPTPG